MGSYHQGGTFSTMYYTLFFRVCLEASSSYLAEGRFNRVFVYL